MKRKHPELTEIEILERIIEGTLVLDFDNFRIISYARKQTREIRTRPSGRGGRYLCVRIKWHNKRRNMPVHRLAWLAYTLQPIPHDHEIHHVDRNSLNWHYSNLECLSPAEHSERHGVVDAEFT